MVLVLAPLFGVLILAGLAGHLVQGRPGFTASKLAPEFSKISPHGRASSGSSAWMAG